MLRATEIARAVVHVPEILYHWRELRGLGLRRHRRQAVGLSKQAGARSRRRLPGAGSRRVVEPHARFARELPPPPGDPGRAAREHHGPVPGRAGDDGRRATARCSKRPAMRTSSSSSSTTAASSPRPGRSRPSSPGTRTCASCAPAGLQLGRDQQRRRRRGPRRGAVVRRTTTSRPARRAGWPRCWAMRSARRSAPSAPCSDTPTSPSSTPASCSA